jgi:tellurite resistance protein
MATRADFTEEEWETMRKGVTGAGVLVSIGDRDFTDTFGEVGALTKRLSEEREQSRSQLMRELATGRPRGFGLTASTEEVEAETLEALRSAIAILAAKAPDEAAAYRQLVLDVAESVADAKGGVKPGETGAIDKVKGALGQTSERT